MSDHHPHPLPLPLSDFHREVSYTGKGKVNEQSREEHGRARSQRASEANARATRPGRRPYQAIVVGGLVGVTPATYMMLI